MSYILDALRRADAERERGAVPGLYTQPALADSGAPERALWPWAITAVVVVAGGVAAVNALIAGPEAPATAPVQAPVQSSVQPPVQAPVRPLAMVVPASAPAMPSAPATAAAPVAAPATATARAPAAAPSAALPRPAVRPSEGGLAAPQVPPPAADAPPVRTGAPAAAAASRAPEGSDAGRVPMLSELPDDVRRSLPALAINGASYSETPAHRMLIANGQVFREGDEPAPGLVLEQIRAKSAVLRWRGVRYSVPY